MEKTYRRKTLILEIIEKAFFFYFFHTSRL